ncbi:serine hydrolase domain-containing protein [Singulisphaera rosea]
MLDPDSRRCELRDRIESVLDQHVRPGLLVDGGDVELVGVDEADIVPNRASGYRQIGGVLKNQEWFPSSINATADSGLYLTVLDLAKWDAGLRSEAVLKQATLQQMWTPTRLADLSTHPYGFGWELGKVNGQRVVEHSGTWQGFAAHIARYLDDELTVIVMTNAVHGQPARLVHRIAAKLQGTPRLRAKPLVPPA